MRAAFLIPYFGTTPTWMLYFLESCRHNPRFTWILYGNLQLQSQPPENVVVVPATIDDFVQRVRHRLKLAIELPFPYKLCDFRACYGEIFQDLLSEYSYWGYCDIDLIFGDIAHFIDSNTWKNYDILSTKSHYVTGHFCLFRNRPDINALFRRIRHWEQILSDTQRHYAIDERSNLTGNWLHGRTRTMTDRLKRRVYYRLYQRGIFTFDLTQVLQRENRKGTLRLGCIPHVKSDRYFEKEGLTQWEVIWREGTLMYQQEELLYFHFLKSKGRYTQLPGSHPGASFAIRPHGIEPY